MRDLPLNLPNRTANPVTIPASDLSWTAARASGPGGQNVNQVATKVDLRFDLPGCTSLPSEVKTRLGQQQARRFDADGRLVVIAQSARTQARNLEIARARLAEMIEAAFVRPKVRRATRPTRGSKRRRLDAKRRTAEKKAGRGKVSL